MALYARAERTSNIVTANAALEIAPSATNGFRLLEFGLTQVTAAATVIGLGKAAANSGTPAGGGLVIAEDNGNSTTGQTNTALTYTTGPTAPTTFLRRAAFPATIGAGIIWTFPRGVNWLKALTNNTLVAWNILGGATLDVWFVVDE
jgi:hypothetical protein